MRVTVQLDAHFPARTLEMNQVLCETLVYLQSPTVAKKAIALLKQAPTQEEQLEYARSLRMLNTGWTNELRTEYIQWFLNAANYRGGRSFEIFVENIRKDALNTLTDKEQKDLAEVLMRQAKKKSPMEALTAAAMQGRAFVKNWTMEDVTGLLGRKPRKSRFRQWACHVRSSRLLRLPPFRQRGWIQWARFDWIRRTLLSRRLYRSDYQSE